MRRKKRNAVILIVCALALAALGVLGFFVLSMEKHDRFSPQKFPPQKQESRAAVPASSHLEATANQVIEIELEEEEEEINYLETNGIFELPVSGSSGYASVPVGLYGETDENGEILAVLAPGDGFRICREAGNWWLVEADGMQGWVMHRYCMVNLPDLLPSIVYRVDNAKASLLRSSGKTIPGLTGEVLYQAYGWNPRLEREEFIVPVLYEMAKKIGKAQQSAAEDGNTLIIYEAFRPYEVQRRIAASLEALMAADAEVLEGVNRGPWSEGWFVATRISNHQRGYAIDVSLGAVTGREESRSGSYVYSRITDAAEYEMPSPMHELSAAAVCFENPISSGDREAWKTAAPAQTMTPAASLLQRYCTEAGMSPLASEWWHFNDLDCRDALGEQAGTGQFFIDAVYSVPPEDF